MMNKYKWIIGSLIFILVAVICFYSLEIFKLKRDYEMLRLSQVSSQDKNFEPIAVNNESDNKDENLETSEIENLEDSKLFGDEFYNSGANLQFDEDDSAIEKQIEKVPEIVQEKPKEVKKVNPTPTKEAQPATKSTKTTAPTQSKKTTTNVNGKKCYKDLNMCFLQLSPVSISSKGYKPLDCSEGKNPDKCGVIPSKTTEDYWAGAKLACEANNMWMPDLTVLSSAFLSMSDKTPFQQDYYTTNEISPRRVISVTSMGNEFRTAKTDTNVYALCVEYIE